MKIIKQSFEIMQLPINALELIEKAGRICHKSENKINNESAKVFVTKILELGHESVFEHVSLTIRLITNRGVTHELVRHRLCAFSQESTRYVKYSDIEFIEPVWWNDWSIKQQNIWLDSMKRAEESYRQLVDNGAEAEQAREVLPNSLKTEIVVTANLREWRHILKLRCSEKAHPQIHELMNDCLIVLKREVPIMFDEI